jgi:hypothetical protein
LHPDPCTSRHVSLRWAMVGDQPGPEDIDALCRVCFVTPAGLRPTVNSA